MDLFSSEQPANHDGFGGALLQSVAAIIAANASNPQFGVPQLAQEIGVSPTHLKRLLRKSAKVSPGQLIRTYRLQKAASLLQDQQLLVKEVAYAVGFRQPTAFTAAFRSVYGCSPAEYQHRFAGDRPRNYRGPYPPGQAPEGEWEALVAAHAWLAEFFEVLGRFFPAEELAIEALARQLLMSPKQLTRRLREVVGLPPARLVRYLRLEFGEYLLCSTDYSITEIAYETGFSDTAHFCRAFRSLYRLSPGDFRKLQQPYQGNTFFKKFYEGRNA
ncbi:MAG: helix-turn-helix domain-containing protein [Salibacteraceae bacterium]